MHAAILAHDARKEQFRLATECLSQLVVEVGKVRRIRLVALEVSQHQPLAGKVVNERAGLRVLQHPPDLLSEHRRLAQFALRRDGQQLVVRDAAPEKK